MTNVLGRFDFDVIAKWIRPGEKVLDLGCGDGSLLRYLRDEKGVLGYGVDNDADNVLACIRNGVNVIQIDLDAGLSGFEDGFFDHVVMSLSLQTVRHTEQLLAEMLRVGREAVVSFPNFGHWSHRAQILRGRMPVSESLPYQWYDTPNIHLCTVADFDAFLAQRGCEVEDRVVLTGGRPVGMLPNLFGELAIYRCTRSR